MKQKWTRGQTVDTLYFLGAALVSAGVWLLLPAGGLITAGGFALLASVLADRGEGSPGKESEGDDRP